MFWTDGRGVGRKRDLATLNAARSARWPLFRNGARCAAETHRRPADSPGNWQTAAPGSQIACPIATKPPAASFAAAGQSPAIPRTLGLPLGELPSRNAMAAQQTIRFQEISVSATDFLHELNDPALIKTREIPGEALVALRRKQINRLRENIVLLTAKREEFNRKLDDYIENLRSLVRAIEENIQRTLEAKSPEASEAQRPATVVRCLSCDAQRVFKDIQVIYAKESEESLTAPTALYVLDGMAFKKGHFVCDSCGGGHLVIRCV